LSNALITVVNIAVAAAITAGLLALAGVGDEDTRSRSEAEVREQRIDQAARRLAADLVEQSPEVCEFIIQPVSNSDAVVSEVVIFGDSEPEYWARLSGEEKSAASDKLSQMLRAECDGRGD
jgi:D-Tyr-tRNAtyr deacylase